MGWESNNNNGVEDSLQLHGEARNKRAVGVIGRCAAEGSVILPSLHMIILPVETNNTLGGNLGIQNTCRQHCQKTPIACIDNMYCFFCYVHLV
jgi:hypothetical protein